MDNKKFFSPILLVRYNKAFVGVRTTFILVWKQMEEKNPNYHWKHFMVFYGIVLILFNPPPLSIFGLLSARCDQNSGPRKIFSFMENNILSDRS